MKPYRAKNFNDAYLEWAYGGGRRDPRYINWKRMRCGLILGTFPLWGLGVFVLIKALVGF